MYQTGHAYFGSCRGLPPCQFRKSHARGCVVQLQQPINKASFPWALPIVYKLVTLTIPFCTCTIACTELNLFAIVSQAKEKQRSGWEQWSNRSSGVGRAARAPTGRAVVLEPHIQQAGAAAAAAVASMLDGRLNALPSAADGQSGAAVVEQALLLGALLTHKLACAVYCGSNLAMTMKWLNS